MALQQFTDITGSPTWYDPVAKVVYTQGGTNPTQYKSPAEWNTRQQKVHPERIKGAGNANPERAPSASGTGASAGQPTIDLNALYESATNTDEIKGLKSELQTKKDALARALKDINDNPFYSEATRVGKIDKLNTNAQNEINNLEGQLATRLSDAQSKINIATQQYNIDNQQYKDNLDRLNFLIDSGALANASGSELAQLSLATGVSSDMLRGIQSGMTTSNVSPQVITSTNNAGEVTVAVVDKNSGNIISSRSLGNVGKSATNEADAQREQAFYKAVDSGIQQLQSGEPWGTVWNRIKLRFPEVSDPVIDTMLGKANWYEPGSYEAYKDRTNY